MQMQAKGLVIREQNTGETDRLVTVLTDEYGVLRAFVRGARSLKSRLHSATQLFCYSRLSIYRGRDAYIIDEAQPIEVFFDLRSDIERLSLAQYFAQLAGELAEQEAQAKEFLRLVLNALHLLCGGRKPLDLLKPAVELRMLCLAGYMPHLVGCQTCGLFEAGTLFFDVEQGCFYCPDCRPGGRGVPLPLGVVTAMRFICLSEPEKIFSFSLPPESLKCLRQISERYLLARVQRPFTTLDFYHSLTDGSEPFPQG